MREFAWQSHYPERVDWNMTIPVQPLAQLLDAAAHKFPNNLAIDFLGTKITYAQLQKNVERFAVGLQQSGLKKGERVGILLPNCPQQITAYYGILKAGGIVVNLSPLCSERELANQIQEAGITRVITMSLAVCLPKVLPLLESGKLTQLIVCSLQEALPFPLNLLFPIVKRKELWHAPNHPHVISYKNLLETTEEYKPVSISPTEDVAVLQFTGGTTGVPKAAMLTHANLYANALQCQAWMVGLEEGRERMMGVLPFFHVFAMTAVMNLAIAGGHTIILHPKFELKKVLKDVARKRPTLMPGVPTMYNAIARSPLVEKYNLSSIKMCISGGAPLPIEIKQAFEKITNCTLVEGYGLTEAAPVCACNPLFGQQKTGSIGLPLPGTIIEIRDPEHPDTEMPTGQIGELCIRGPQVMKGYWNRPEETEKCLKDGLLRTGDLGYIDEQGYVFVVDRLKEMIITGGFNVYPRHVEEVLYEHPAVLECAVVGAKDDHYGQKVKAFVVPKPGQTLSEGTLIDFLKNKLSKYEVPKEIEFRQSLPKTMIGKISKKDL